MAGDFRFRFSSKYLDGEIGLYYYGYRWYSPALGRWVSRDPIEELGGPGLYGFVSNDGVDRWDLLGMTDDSGDGVCCLLDEAFTFMRNSASEADRIQKEEYPGYIDPFEGDYRHCVSACILVRSAGPLTAACVLGAWDLQEDDPSDSAAGWRGYAGAMKNPITSCRELCKGLNKRPIGPIDPEWSEK